VSPSSTLTHLLRDALPALAHLGVLLLLARAPLQSARGATGLVGPALRLHGALRGLFPGLPLSSLACLLLAPLLLALALARLEARALSALAPRGPSGLTACPLTSAPEAQE